MLFGRFGTNSSAFFMQGNMCRTRPHYSRMHKCQKKGGASTTGYLYPPVSLRFSESQPDGNV